MKTRMVLCLIVAVWMAFYGYVGSVWGYTESGDNNFFGGGAGSKTTGTADTFIGAYAGFFNTTGTDNSFVGYSAGYSNTMGNDNTFLGSEAGYSNKGSYNSFLGFEAGLNNITGSGNVFLGFEAGSTETGSNKLYIANSDTASPLIYGDFNSSILSINGNVGIGTSTPTGPLTIVSPIAGSLIQMSTTSSAGGAGFSFMVPTGGDWFFKATEDNGFKIRDATNSKDVMYFQYATGNVGIGTDAQAHPLHLGGGAYSDGVSWINGSSREYKENIRDLRTEEALSAFNGLNPVAFTYKAKAGEQHIGFIAEDVPELVATKDRKGLSPMDIVAVVTKVVQEQRKSMEAQQRAVEEEQRTNQEQQTVIKILAEKLAQLEAKIEDLQTRGNPVPILSQK